MFRVSAALVRFGGLTLAKFSALVEASKEKINVKRNGENNRKKNILIKD